MGMSAFLETLRKTPQPIHSCGGDFTSDVTGIKVTRRSPVREINGSEIRWTETSVEMCHRACEVVAVYGIGESFGDGSLPPADKPGAGLQTQTSGARPGGPLRRCGVSLNVRIFDTYRETVLAAIRAAGRCVEPAIVQGWGCVASGQLMDRLGTPIRCKVKLRTIQFVSSPASSHPDTPSPPLI